MTESGQKIIIVADGISLRKGEYSLRKSEYSLMKSESRSLAAAADSGSNVSSSFSLAAAAPLDYSRV